MKACHGGRGFRRDKLNKRLVKSVERGVSWRLYVIVSSEVVDGLTEYEVWARRSKGQADAGIPFMPVEHVVSHVIPVTN